MGISPNQPRLAAPHVGYKYVYPVAAVSDCSLVPVLKMSACHFPKTTHVALSTFFPECIICMNRTWTMYMNETNDLGKKDTHFPPLSFLLQLSNLLWIGGRLVCLTKADCCVTVCFEDGSTMCIPTWKLIEDLVTR